MRVRHAETGKEYDLEGTPLGSGGEAVVFAVPDQPDYAAKIYHKPNPEYAEKLEAMLAAPPVDPMAQSQHVSIAWPIGRLEATTPEANLVGFLMPRIDQARGINEYYIPKLRQQLCPLFHYGYLLRTARNLAAAVRALHERGYAVGDLSGANVLVTNQALVTLIDTDSFQVRAAERIFRCRVGTPEYTPPELQHTRFAEIDRAPEHDTFGLAVLIFQLLMQGTHPFAGVFAGQGEPGTIPRRIALGYWPYARDKDVPFLPNPHAPPLEVLPAPLPELMQRCFEAGHTQPKQRPSAHEWQYGLQEAEKTLIVCSANSQHQFPRGLASCPWCALARQQGRDPYPSLQALKTALTPVSNVTLANSVSVAPSASATDIPVARVASPLVGSAAMRRKVKRIARQPWLWIGASAAAFSFVVLVALIVILRPVPSATSAHAAGQHPGEPTPIDTSLPPSRPPDVPTVVPPRPLPVPPAPDKRPLPEPRDFGPLPQPITVLALAPDCQTALSGGTDACVHRWNLHDGTELAFRKSHRNPITALAFSPDGLSAVSGSEDQTLRLWDVRAGTEERRFVAHTLAITGVAFSPKGREFLSGSADHTVRLWETSQDRPHRPLRGHTQAVLAVAFSMDGRLAASGGADNVIYLWDTERGDKRATLKGHEHAIRSLGFAPNGLLLASGSSDGSVRIWDPATGKEVQRFQGKSGCTSVAFADNDRLLAGFLDGSVIGWVVSSQLELSGLPRHAGAVTALAVSVKHGLALSASLDKSLRLWRLPGPDDVLARTTPPPQPHSFAAFRTHPSGEVLRLQEHTDAVLSAAVRPNGKEVITAGADAKLLVWSLDSGQVVRRLEGHSGAIARVLISLDGRRALSVSADGSLRSWDLSTGKLISKVESAGVDFTSAALMPDGVNAMAGSKDGRLWISDGKELRPVKVHKGEVLNIDISADGKLALSTGADGATYLWEMATGKKIDSYGAEAGSTRVARFTPDAQNIVLGALDRTGPIRLLTRAGMQEVRHFGSNDDLAQALTLSPDARQVLLGTPTGKVELRDLETGALQARFAGHGGAVNCVAFLPQLRYVLSAGADRSVRIWEVPAGVRVEAKPPENLGKQLHVFKGHTGGIDAVGIAKDGQKVYSTCASDHTLREWDTAEDTQKRAINFGNRYNLREAGFPPGSRLGYLLHADGVIHTIDLETGQTNLMRANIGRQMKFANQAVRQFVVAPDGSRLLAFGLNRIIGWDTRLERPVVSLPQDVFDSRLPAGPHSLSAKGQFALFREGKHLMLWNLVAMGPVRRFDFRRVLTAAALSPDGQRALLAGAGQTAIWDATTGRELAALNDPDSVTRCAVFSPNNRYLLTGTDKGVVRLWQVEGGKEVSRFKGHTGAITSLNISADGRFAVSGGSDATVRVWELPDEVKVDAE